MNLTEILATVVIAGLLTSVGFVGAREPLARQELETASREIWLGLERARQVAERRGMACTMELGPRGWQVPAGSSGCEGAQSELFDLNGNSSLQISNNFAAALNFTPNGLILGGGTVILSHSGTSLRRCLVISLPLGATRIGRYGSANNNNTCLPDG